MSSNLFYEIYREQELKNMKFLIQEALERTLHIRDFNEQDLENIINENYIEPLIIKLKDKGINSYNDINLPLTQEIIQEMKDVFQKKLNKLVFGNK
jgi:hypothetical protein